MLSSIHTYVFPYNLEGFLMTGIIFLLIYLISVHIWNHPHKIALLSYLIVQQAVCVFSNDITYYS